MPGKTKGSANDKSNLKKINPAVIKSVWGQIDIQDWMHILRGAHSSNRWSFAGRRISGICPFHNDRDPSFVIDFEKRYAKCYSPDCGVFFWDPVRFYQELQPTQSSYISALGELKDRFNISLPVKTIREIGKRWKHREMKRLLYKLTNGELCDVATVKGNPELTYGQNTVKYLDMREVPKVYHFLPIGILPPELRLKDLVDQHCAADGLSKKETQDLWDSIKEYLAFAGKDVRWVGSLLFFTGDSPQDPCKVKIRRIPNYTNGMFMAGDKKDVAFLPDDQEEHNGIFGLFGTDLYKPFFASRDVKSFYFVEGEFDALNIMARQFDTGRVGFFCFSGGGGAVGSVDMMANYGFETGYVIGDKDAGGEGFIKEVLKSTLRVAIRAFNWPDTLDMPNQDTVDPDEAVLQYGLEVVEEEFCKEANYSLPYRWSARRASEEMSGVPEGDIRQLTNIAARWGRYVRDKSEQQAYLQEICKAFNVNAGLILNEMIAGDDNEEAFIERIRLVLEGRLHVLHSVKEGNSQVLRVFDRQTNAIYDLPLMEDKRIAATIELMVRKDLYLWVREEVGEPGFLDTYDEMSSGTDMFYMKYSAIIMQSVSKAVTRLSSCLPCHANVRYLGAGMHCVIEEEGTPNEATVLYLVNGMDLYKGTFKDGGRLVWAKLPGPSDGDVVVFAQGNTRPKTHFPQITSEVDLNQTVNVTLADLYEELRQVINIGWDFKHHKVTVDLLTALMMQVYVANCLPRQPVVMLTSEQSGGKSSFLGGLLGRVTNPRINVVQPSLFMDNYTAAGVRQSMNYSSVCLCLDEFEDKGGNDRKSLAVRGVLLLLRGLANAEGSTILGSASGRHQEFSFHAPVFVAGIRGLTDPADISRFIIVEMDKKSARKTPETMLMDNFGEKKLKRIQQLLPIVLFQHAQKIREALVEISEEYKDGGGLEYGMISRNREHYYGALAIMRVCGRDYKKFIHDYFRANRSNLERMAQSSMSNDLFNEVLYSPTIRVPDVNDARDRTINDIVSGDNPESLNFSNSGCYYDKPTNWLLIHWGTARQTVLKNTEFNRRTPHWLKAHAQRSSYHIHDDDVKKSGVLQRLQQFLGRLGQLRDISVYKVGDLIADIEDSSKVVVKFMEDIDYTDEYADRLSKITFPEPPKKVEKGGTSKSPKETEGSSDKAESVDNEFNY
jgi:hypothetical protein